MRRPSRRGATAGDRCTRCRTASPSSSSRRRGSRKGGLFLLDETEAALSASRLLSFLTVLHRLARGGSQLLIATHSPILTAYPDAFIYELGAWGVRRVRYEETANYEVTKAFLAAPERYLRHLLDGEDDG